MVLVEQEILYLIQTLDHLLTIHNHSLHLRTCAHIQAIQQIPYIDLTKTFIALNCLYALVKAFHKLLFIAVDFWTGLRNTHQLMANTWNFLLDLQALKTSEDEINGLFKDD